ncbi:MAG: hypothetical protein SGBAC_013266, partial [Bacillariaceae sp.]
MLRQQLQKYHHQRRLLFSTTTTKTTTKTKSKSTATATAAAAARRRRKKPKLPFTTKDRLRRVVPRSPQQPLKIDADLVTERLQTRLDWVRSNIEGLWKDPNATNRPDRYELAIDGNWWTWNLLLALTPGILIAAYCEFVAKPMMLEQRKDGSDGLPQPSSNAFLGDLYDGLMHYMYGMEPANTNHIQSETKNSTTALDAKSSLSETDLQQLQALKEKIQELEDRLTAPQRPGLGIRQRHQMTAPNKPEEPPSDAAGESVTSATGWILQTLTES